VSDFQPGELLPTWEQLLSGAGAGARGRSTWRFAPVTPRHVRAWPEDGSPDWSADWSADWSPDWSADWSADWEHCWAELERELRLDTEMSWREACAWTALATACAALASSAAGLLR
jgi:hypothetical protein